MLDELAHAGPEHLDPDFVAGYERKQGYPDPAEDLAVLAPTGWMRRRRWWTSAPGRAGSRWLPRAGSGRSRPSTSHRRCWRSCASGPPLPSGANLECVQGGFLSYQHTGPPADAVYTRNALHQLPDFWKAIALDRIRGMLRPGGVLRLRDLVYDFQPSQAEEVFGRWLEGAADDPALGYTSADFAEHIRSEHSTFRWLLEPMLAATGFEIVTADFSGSVYGAYTCRRR
jgi:hypothetical protein